MPENSHSKLRISFTGQDQPVGGLAAAYGSARRVDDYAVVRNRDLAVEHDGAAGEGELVEWHPNSAVRSLPFRSG
jgi:hypothetical protein